MWNMTVQGTRQQCYYEIVWNVPTLYGQVLVHVRKNTISKKEKRRILKSVLDGSLKIIFGARSAVFLPFHNLGLVIVDEEHDLSFKQMDKFRYSARDMALYRAKLEKVPVVLASATPSLETLKNAQEDKYTVLKLSKRATGASLPTFQAVDLRGKELYEGLSKELLEATRSELSKGNQVSTGSETRKPLGFIQPKLRPCLCGRCVSRCHTRGNWRSNARPTPHSIAQRRFSRLGTRRPS